VRSVPEAMRAHDLKPQLDWDHPKLGIAEWLDRNRWVMQEKLDGNRAMLGMRTDRNDFGQGRAHIFPQFRDAVVEGMAGTILDGEFLAQPPPGGSVLNYSSGLFNSGAANAARLMAANGPPTFWVFDVLEVCGHDITSQPYEFRRAKLEIAVAMLQTAHPECGIRLVKDLPPTAAGIRKVLARGGEGVMLKRLGSSYQRGRRSWDWLKVKGSSTIDAFVTGWRPGEGYNEGQVGSVELSILDGREPRMIAAINIPPEVRARISAPDGSLRKEFYGTVIEITGHGINVNGQVNTAIFARLRPDKGEGDCLADQLEVLPHV
jgi:ATP-dependent DNA ligase